MGLFDDVEVEAPEESAEPRMPGYHQARSRRVVQVDPVHITGTPEGTGSIRTRGGSHVEEDAELTGLFEKEAPAAPPTEREYRDHVRAEEDASDGEGALWSDTLATLAPVYDTDEARREGVTRRMGRRASRAAEEGAEDPIALLMGAGAGVPVVGSWLDEIGGALAASSTDAGAAGIVPGLDYETTRDGIREEMEGAEERSPYAFGAGEAASTIGTLPLLGAEAGAEAGLSAGSRIVSGAATGMGIGGLTAAGESDGGASFLDDTLEGAALGGALGGVVSTGAEAVRGAGRLASTARTAADRARVAAVGGGASPSIGDRLMREFEAMPGGTTGQAERIRRLDIVGPASHARDILERADAAVVRTGEEGVLGDVIRRIEESGQRMPVRDLVRQFEQVATRMEQNPELAPYAPMVRRRGEQWAQSFGAVSGGERPMFDLGAEVEPSRVREALGTMRDQTQWLDPVAGAVRPPVQASRDLHRSLSRTRDSWVDDVLGPGEGSAYREARLDLGTAMQSQEAAEQAAQRAARSRGISMTDYLAMQAGASSGQGGMTQALGSMLLNRSWRGREGALRATGTEAIARILEAGGASQALGRYGPILQRALERGAPSLARTHYALSQSDPEYREMTAELEASDGTGELPEGFTYEDAAPPQ